MSNQALRIFVRGGLMSWWLMGAVCLSQQQPTAPARPAEEVILPQQFTEILKQVWGLLKEEITQYLTAIEKKMEFETSSEFERRVVDTKRQYLAKVIKYSRDQRYHERVFGVLFKARLDAYDADKQFYSVSSPTIVEAPYNIPSVQCTVPKNNYVAFADSIRSGYRTSSVYIKLPKGFRWQVGREAARAAKTDADNIFFKVKMTINIEQPEVKQIATLLIVPREIALINNRTNQVYWSQRIQ